MYVTMTDAYPGVWGSGETEEHAMKNCKSQGGRGPWIVTRIDDHWEQASIDQMGRMSACIKDEFESMPRAERPPIVAEAWRVGVRGKRVKVDPVTGKP